METMCIEGKDVAEPDQVVSGEAGTGQEKNTKQERLCGQKTGSHFYNTGIRTRPVKRELRARAADRSPADPAGCREERGDK